MTDETKEDLQRFVKDTFRTLRDIEPQTKRADKDRDDQTKRDRQAYKNTKDVRKKDARYIMKNDNDQKLPKTKESMKLLGAQFDK